jgi:hypothetical protein
MAFSPRKTRVSFSPERSVPRYTYMRLKYDKLSCKKKRYYMSILEMAEKHTGN